MTFLSAWEAELLSTLLGAYEQSDFNCGAKYSEQKSVHCAKAEDDNIHLDLPCDSCKYGKRFLKLVNKINRSRSL